MIRSKAVPRRRRCITPITPFKPRRQYYSLTTSNSIARVSRFVTSPTMFMLHFSGLSIGVSFTAAIGARNASSRARIAKENEEAESYHVQEQVPAKGLGLADMIEEGDTSERTPPPQPSPSQLRRLSAVLRTQIADTNRGFDALFTLRQLHMMRRPQLALPSPTTFDSALPLKRESWLWRLPAATAIHSIVRRGDASLMGAAVRLTSNALTWDQMMKMVVGGEVELPVVVGSEFRLRAPIIYEALDPYQKPSPPLPPTINPDLASSFLSEPSLPIEETVIIPTSLSPLAPPSSLHHQTIELLFLHLARAPRRSHHTALVALSISLACARLEIPVSSRMHWHTVKICLDLDRIDLACKAWARWLTAVDLTGPSSRGLRLMFDQVKKQLRPGRMEFSRSMSIKTLSGVAALTRALDSLESLENANAVELLHLLVDFPAPRRTKALDKGLVDRVEGTGTFESHLRVYTMIEEVMRRKVERLVRRPILKSTATGYFIDHSAPQSDIISPVVSIYAYNSLLLYSLRRLKSVDIANHLIDLLNEYQLPPSAATQNILLQHASLHNLKTHQYGPVDRLQNPRSLPAFISYLSKMSNYIALDRIVFSILDELQVADSLPPGTIPTAVAPPPGRSSYLYTTLLTALQKAGRTGLAERVFRQARWAASLSRTTEGVKPWVLPEVAFTIMLNLYAAESRKGRNRSVERNEFGRGKVDDRWDNGTVVGWGRHALRVFFIRAEQAEAIARFGSSVEVRQFRETRSLEIPSIERWRAAPIVALWELEGGSEPAELKSLQSALKSRYSRRAVSRLFPNFDSRSTRPDFEPSKRNIESYDDGVD